MFRFFISVFAKVNFLSFKNSISICDWYQFVMNRLYESLLVSELNNIRDAKI